MTGILANGVNKILTIAKETTFGVAPTTGGQELRRTSSTIGVARENFTSNEITSHQQVSDMKLGTRSATGTIEGELSPKTYSDFMAAVLRKDFVAGGTFSATTGDGIVSSSVSKTFTRANATESFIDDGFKVGDIVRWTNLAATANNNKNFRITALTATVMTVAEAVATDAVSDEACSCAVIGKKTWIPTSGHTYDSFTVEHWQADIEQDELHSGVLPSEMTISVPATGIATISTTMLGMGVYASGATQHFTTPTAPTNTGLLTSVYGSLSVNGTDIAIATSMNVTITGNAEVQPVVGSNFSPSVFRGKVQVSGTVTAFLEDGTLNDAFINETETSLRIVLNTSSTANSDFIAINLPKIKLSSATKDDNEKGIVGTYNFTSLENVSGTSDEETSTIVIQDSTL